VVGIVGVAQPLDQEVQLFFFQLRGIHSEEGGAGALGQLDEIFPGVGILAALPNDVGDLLRHQPKKPLHPMALDEGGHVVFESVQIVRRKHGFLLIILLRAFAVIFRKCRGSSGTSSSAPTSASQAARADAAIKRARPSCKRPSSANLRSWDSRERSGRTGPAALTSASTGPTLSSIQKRCGTAACVWRTWMRSFNRTSWAESRWRAC